MSSLNDDSNYRAVNIILQQQIKTLALPRYEVIKRDARRHTQPSLCEGDNDLFLLQLIHLAHVPRCHGH